MTAGSGSAREAVERNARAVMTGNFTQLMADITPEALTRMLAMAAKVPQAQGMLMGGVPAAGQLPAITGFDVHDAGASENGDENYHVTFTSDARTATVASTWRQIMGQWKIVDVNVIAVDPPVEGLP